MTAFASRSAFFNNERRHTLELALRRAIEHIARLYGKGRGGSNALAQLKESMKRMSQFCRLSYGLKLQVCLLDTRESAYSV